MKNVFNDIYEVYVFNKINPAWQKMVLANKMLIRRDRMVKPNTSPH